MTDIFVNNVYINQVRHLNNINIELSSTEKKHLIITGKNGSGKTSILSTIRNVLAGEILGWTKTYQDITNIRSNFHSNLYNIENSMRQISEQIRNSGVGDYSIDQQRINLESYQRIKRDYDNIIAYFDRLLSGNYPIGLAIKGRENMPNLHSLNQFIVHFFDAKRTSYVGNPTGIYGGAQNISNSILNTVNPNFLQYIINLRAEQSFARDDNDIYTVNRIQNWFSNFTKQLSILFDTDSLNLRFDRTKFNFFIDIPNRQSFDLNSMSDGYSAILSIVTEIMLRMTRNSDNYEMQGIVLIDEIETHLHIDLQKKILPFLIKFFPNIQFIISSHSPFILNSVSNAIVFDLEKNIRVEDLTRYSMEGIVEGYFKQDQYSEEVKNRLQEYEQLAMNKDRNPENQERYIFLQNYFKELPEINSEELELKLQQIKLATL